jgi:hypothetical protein
MRIAHLLFAALLLVPAALRAEPVTFTGTVVTLPGTSNCEIVWDSYSVTVGDIEAQGCYWVSFNFAAHSTLADHNPVGVGVTLQVFNPKTNKWGQATFVSDPRKPGKYGLLPGKYRAVAHAVCQKGHSDTKIVEFTVGKA